MKINTRQFPALTTLVLSCVCVSAQDTGMGSAFEELKDVFAGIDDQISSVRTILGGLARQVMLQQMFVEERIRTDGDSGVKSMRGSKKGLKNYISKSHVGGAICAIHDHSNYDRTVGMGEISVVMNGVEFRTRHNDYKLMMPSTTDTGYNAVEPIPFPEVPPEVLDLESVDDQITEMREWFRAFKNQDTSIRDYPKYFKPVLCYLEGAWTLDAELDEPFQSDRHQIDASSWFDLQEKIRFTSYSGAKSRLENFAYLPTTIMSVNETTGTPTYAQWNYRILCKPVDRDIPFSVLQQVDDLVVRVPNGQTLNDVRDARTARFKLYEGTANQNYQLLDEIFYTIPGKDNIPEDLTQDSFGDGLMYDVAYTEELVKLNTGYYHRWFKYSKAGAMGLTTVARGFNDDNMWVAQTTQKRVAPMALESCQRVSVDGGKKKKVCTTNYNRFSYSIPLEIVYLTPLLSWNPYKLTILEDPDAAREGGRTGANSAEKAYKGADPAKYYLTPITFFKGKTDKSDSADTVRNNVHVLDPDGEIRKMSATGTRIMLPEIEGIGSVRLRWPIAPVHGEGSAVWKELNALKDTVTGGVGGPPSMVAFQMSTTVQDPPGEHTHEFTLTYQEFQLLTGGNEVNVTTDQAQGHTHDLTLSFDSRKKIVEYIHCGTTELCMDGHDPQVFLLTNNVYTELG